MIHTEKYPEGCQHHSEHTYTLPSNPVQRSRTNSWRCVGMNMKPKMGWLSVAEFLIAAGMICLTITFVATRDLLYLMGLALGALSWWLTIRPLRILSANAESSKRLD